MSLRGAFTADLPLKLTSLGLSVFLWLLAASGLRVLAPGGLEATALPDSVTLLRRSADG